MADEKLHPFQVTFTQPERPDFEITKMVQARDGEHAVEQIKALHPDIEVLGSQQLFVFRRFRAGNE
jgi:hypothetical protein